MSKSLASKLLLALVLMGTLFASTWTLASADTRTFGSVQGQTYLNNYWDGYSHGVWGSTRRTDWAFAHMRLELHPQYATTTCVVPNPLGGCLVWLTTWYNRPVKIVDRSDLNYLSTDDFQSNHAMRGWSYHKDYTTGNAGTTSDGY